MLKKGLKKFSALAAAVVAAISGGGPAPVAARSSAPGVLTTPKPVPNHPPQPIRIQLFPEARKTLLDMGGMASTDYRPRGPGRNQRKKRKAARRAWANGNKKAFV
jgi:hypothetical protein